MLHKSTKSTETHKAHQGESNDTQTYVTTNSSTQTKTDNYANTKRVLRFNYGLRGIRGNYSFMLDLSEPLIMYNKNKNNK